jgi:hypothetical protein
MAPSNIALIGSYYHDLPVRTENRMNHDEQQACASVWFIHEKPIHNIGYLLNITDDPSPTKTRSIIKCHNVLINLNKTQKTRPNSSTVPTPAWLNRSSP